MTTQKIRMLLDDPSSWPKHLIDLLSQQHVVDLIKHHSWIGELVANSTILPILSEVESIIATNDLSAFHCTKQLPDRPYAHTGLRPLSFEQHHAEFRELLRHHPGVTKALFAKFDQGLAEWRVQHTGRREGMLWFCIDRPLVLDPGTRDFFKFFGGEAIYFWLKSEVEISAFLETLGEPVVVEARISSKDLNTHLDFPLGRTLVSYFAQSINPEFNIEHREGYVSRSIPPGDIVAVHPLDQFSKVIRPIGW